MRFIYTHLWQHDDRHFESEGTCATSYQEALQHLLDYHDGWQAQHFHYFGTYVENQELGTLHKIDLSDEFHRLLPL
jgi:hypothetical protein